MSNSKKPPVGTPEYESWRKEKAKKRAEQLLDTDSEFEQNGVLNGSQEALREPSKLNINQLNSRL
jgi:hypothetical protein